MEIIQNRKTMKIISILILFVMLIGTITPVFAAVYTNSINIGDTLTLKKGEWFIYKTEAAAKKLDKSQIHNTTLKAGESVTVESKSGNVLKIGTNKYIYYGSTGASSFTRVAATSKDNTPKQPAVSGNKNDSSIKFPTLELPSGGGFGEAISAAISGTVNFITSDEVKNTASKFGDWIMQLINSLLEGLRSIISNIKEFEFPKGIDLPAETTGGETGGTTDKKEDNTIEVTSVTISGETKVKVGEEITLTATVKPSNATNQKVTWTSNSKAATVGKDSGIVKGETAGAKVTITATAANGKKTTYEVSVENAQQDSGGGSAGGTTIDTDEVLIGTKLNVSNITVSNITEGNAVSVGGFSIFDDNKR